MHTLCMYLWVQKVVIKPSFRGVYQLLHKLPKKGHFGSDHASKGITQEFGPNKVYPFMQYLQIGTLRDERDAILYVWGIGMSPNRGISLSRARARDKGIHIGSKTPNTHLERSIKGSRRPSAVPPKDTQTRVGMGYR